MCFSARSAGSALIVVLPAAHEIDDLHLITFADEGLVEGGALQDDDVMFDCDAARIDIELAEQLGDGQRTAQLERFAI